MVLLLPHICYPIEMAFQSPYPTPRRSGYPVNRMYNGNRSFRLWKTRKPQYWKRNRTTHVVSRSPTELFGDPISKQYTRKEICETQEGSEYVLHNNRYMTSYVTYPGKTRTGTNNRVRSYIKLKSLNISGTFAVRTSDMMTEAGQTNGLYGVMSVVVVRDKSPKIYSATQPLIPFVELFGSVNACRGSLKVAERHHERFVLLNQTSIVVNTPYSNAIKKFCIRNCIPRTYTTWVTFKDEEEDSCTGRYSNTLRNAIILYYVWLSDVSSQVDLYSNVILNYIG
ncbi:movement protein [Tomato leaf curl Gujarat virus]|uniref:Nuclear shuttle protein n=2 Tax=Tomato leaf curl Gujarat virus TaxID=219299 RepID=A0ABM5LBU3_9GEMI|nr:movement protein [Tomato leaf curl Gujarat virus]AAO25673.1 movement protein [Tomato leaf curl Gujarat virus - [Varanasi]]AXU38912.1 movement protein [Tomato leaf curl Gujarat virus]